MPPGVTEFIISYYTSKHGTCYSFALAILYRFYYFMPVLAIPYSRVVQRMLCFLEVRVSVSVCLSVCLSVSVGGLRA